jgi:hypothetical protein
MATAPGFFAASAGIAGALIGLLFVAISVTPEKVLGPDAEDVFAVRAAAALTSFVNALSVSLFGLIPGFSSGTPASVVAVLGILFVAAALVRLMPSVRAAELHPRELTFVAGLAMVFIVQLVAGIELSSNESDRGALQVVCIVVVVCFLLGIERAWELLGGPRVRLIGSIARRRRAHSSGEESRGTEE